MSAREEKNGLEPARPRAGEVGSELRSTGARTPRLHRNIRRLRGSRSLVSGLSSLVSPPCSPVSARQCRAAFTLLEVLLAIALVALLLVAMNTFVFSMGELWGKRTDIRLFDQHVRAVTRFLEHELRAAAMPPAAKPNSTPIALQEIKPQGGMMEKLLTFELPAGSRLFAWPERPLPEVVCSFQARQNEGLVMLWHSRLEKNFESDPPRETVVTPLVSALSYDYYDPDSNRWTTENMVKMDPQGQPMTPQRLRLKFTYGKLNRESVVALPAVGEGMPMF